MPADTRSIDVISLYSADGTIQPLRLRLKAEDGTLLSGKVEEILHISESDWLHVECRCFLCRVVLEGRPMVVELKFHFRSHTWSLVRKYC